MFPDEGLPGCESICQDEHPARYTLIAITYFRIPVRLSSDIIRR